MDWKEYQGTFEITLQGTDGFGLIGHPLLTKSMVALPGLDFSVCQPDHTGLVQDCLAVSFSTGAIHFRRERQVAQEIAQFVENTPLQRNIGAIRLARRFHAACAICDELVPATWGAQLDLFDCKKQVSPALFTFFLGHQPGQQTMFPSGGPTAPRKQDHVALAHFFLPHTP